MKKYSLLLPSIIVIGMTSIIGSTFAADVEETMPPDFSGSLEHRDGMPYQSGSNIINTLPSNIQSELQSMKTRHQSEMQALLEKQRSEMATLLTDYPDILTKMQKNQTKNPESINKASKIKTNSTTNNQTRLKTLKEKRQQQKNQTAVTQ